MTKEDNVQNDGSDCNEVIEINTDGRKKLEWKSKYPKDATDQMRNEAIYIAVIFLASLICLLINWLGYFDSWLLSDKNCDRPLRNILFYFFSGMLGGTIFGVKYFYRVVARGYWSEDRIYWRLFTPWTSAAIAMIIGCMMLSGILNSGKEVSDTFNICLGFFAGYFADEAVGKMYEVSTVLFGRSKKS